jgi:FixJ family two-component response regulator
MSGKASFRGEIYVVDDDPAAREMLSRGLREAGYDVIQFVDGAALLTETRARTPACIFIDAHVEGRPLELLKKLRIEPCPAPIFVASAQGNIPLAVDAIKSGAFDFIKKPFCISDVVGRVDAVVGARARAESLEEIGLRSQRLSGEARLTKREREVFALIAMGRTNKEVARELGLSARTVEGYRASVMRKVGATNATELVRRVLDRGRGD